MCRSYQLFCQTFTLMCTGLIHANLWLTSFTELIIWTHAQDHSFSTAKAHILRNSTLVAHFNHLIYPSLLQLLYIFQYSSQSINNESFYNCHIDVVSGSSESGKSKFHALGAWAGDLELLIFTWLLTLKQSVKAYWRLFMSKQQCLTVVKNDNSHPKLIKKVKPNGGSWCWHWVFAEWLHSSLPIKSHSNWQHISLHIHLRKNATFSETRAIF